MDQQDQHIVSSAHSTHIDLALAAWLDAKSRRSNSAKTKKAYTETMASFQAALQRAQLALDSDPAAVATVAQAWAAAGDVAPATHNQRLAIISSFYTFARKRGLLASENPVDRVERQSIQSYAHAEALTPEDVKAALAAIDRRDIVGKRDYALLSVALVTGRRLNEISALCWRDVRIGKDGRVTLTLPHTKGNQVMRDKLPRPVGRALLNYLVSFYVNLNAINPSSPLWVSLSRQNHGKALHSNWLERIARKRLGVHFHALRHTFARNMEDAGAKVSDIQARLGHESLATTGRYLAALRRAENPYADTVAKMFGMEDMEDAEDEGNEDDGM